MTTLNRRQFLAGSAAIAASVAAGSAYGRQATPVATPTTAALDGLRASLRGTLMVPGDSGYLIASQPANARYNDIRPMAIARVADVEDVATCIRWCNETGVLPVPRGGGHSYAGFSTSYGLMIDLRRLNHYNVDYNTGSASVGGAALNGDAMVALENGPAFIPGGTCMGVGYGGLTLGGGIGYNAHWAGLTCDHLVETTVVTADGEIVIANQTENPDLFWACRGGGGGTFGINTSFEFSLLDVPQHDVAWYRFDWYGADDVGAVFAAFDHLIQNAPEELNAVAMMEPIPMENGDANAAVHGMSRGQFIGSLDDLRDLVQPLLNAATPRDELFETMPFWSVQRMIASAEPEPHSWGDISRYSAASLPGDTLEKLVDAVVHCPHREDDVNGSIWSLGWIGGAVSRFGRDETAYVHRTATTLLRPTTVWTADSAEEGAELNEWTDDVIKTLTPYTLAESYQNFPNRDITNWQDLYFAENYPRLREIKSKYDPNNLFRNMQSVTPVE